MKYLIISLNINTHTYFGVDQFKISQQTNLLKKVEIVLIKYYNNLM